MKLVYMKDDLCIIYWCQRPSLVTSDMMSNAQIVPLRVLRGHKVAGELGVMDLDWHANHPLLVSGGGAGTCR